jgi:hypothetical protein
MFIWDWFVGWIIGWGGIGALISVGLWALWYFMPVPTLKATALHAAVIATAITISGTYIFTDGYNKGRADVLHAIAVQDAKAIQERDQANDDVQTCFSGGGSWNIADRVCDAPAGQP